MTHALSRTMSDHHRQCDELFAAVETCAARQDWPAAHAAWRRFLAGMEWHFAAEEARLFPGLEARTGMQGGPTAVMRHEHAQLNELMAAAAAAQATENADAFADVAETLLVMLQQHNLKEENILYRMCDQELGAQGIALSSNFASEIAAL
jgi:hemerythrin-like domain-containing protein